MVAACSNADPSSNRYFIDQPWRCMTSNRLSDVARPDEDVGVDAESRHHGTDGVEDVRRIGELHVEEALVHGRTLDVEQVDAVVVGEHLQ